MLPLPLDAPTLDLRLGERYNRREPRALVIVELRRGRIRERRPGADKGLRVAFAQSFRCSVRRPWSRRDRASRTSVPTTPTAKLAPIKIPTTRPSGSSGMTIAASSKTPAIAVDAPTAPLSLLFDMVFIVSFRYRRLQP
jgi:hypothetical protein